MGSIKGAVFSQCNLLYYKYLPVGKFYGTDKKKFLNPPPNP